jgi:predicted RNase H-like nuclease (RuvC/YqgF family)
VQELFSKLRFSYLEQVTKEKFIRAILGDPPLIVEGSENNALEAELLEVKASLKAQKQDVFNMVAELERHGRELSKQHEGIIMQTTRLKELPMEIEQLQASIAGLREQLAPGPNPELNLPLHKTVELVEEKEKESAELDRILEKLQAELPRKTRATERLEAEVQPLEVKKLGSAASAREAQRRKEVALGGIGDDLEERGRWWRGLESGLKAMLDVEN